MYKTRQQLQHDLQQAALLLGIEEEMLVYRALELYLTGIREHIALAGELRAWQAFSDEVHDSKEHTLVHTPIVFLPQTR